jgi:thermostable 8-oxoguanine DNA glycosylase
MKTSRFYAMHSRENAVYAVLDTHILAYMRENMGIIDAPRSTPTSQRQYLTLEQTYLAHYNNLPTPKPSLAEFDLQIWVSRRRDKK